MARRPCVCFIVPPHVLRHVAEHAPDPAERRKAVSTLTQSAYLLGSRNALSSLPSAAANRDPNSKYRLVYDARSRTRLPGGMVRREGQPATRDAATDEAFDGAGVVYDFFRSVYRRNSLDGKGMMLASTVHYGKGYDNAFWTGGQMVYGDGDGKYFHRFTRSLDIIAHELAHGFTQNTSDLEYADQPGALNEHLSDVFGEMAHQWSTGKTAETASWVIGEGLLCPGVNGTGLRSMKAPGTAYDDKVIGKDAQPSHMKDYNQDDDDNGGVHVNSGIPNHAFYRACAAVGGPSWDKVGKVWYEVAAKQLWADAQFQDMADLTSKTAGDLHGAGGPVERAVRDAWRAVGLTPR